MPITGSAGSRVFTRQVDVYTGSDAWQQLDAAAIGVRSVDQDYEGNDIASALNVMLQKDGGNTATADIPMGGFKLTGGGSATARTHYPLASQVQDGAFNTATTASNDTITATLSPAITAYATGALYVLKAGGTNTGASTLNLNSVGAKDIKKGKAGSLALSAGDFTAGRMGLFAYDGTNMQLLNAPEFPTGTVMLFCQTAAPTGWTKDTSNNNNAALRIVTGTVGTGGTVDFTTAFASQAVAGTIGGTAISIAQMPLHGHPTRYSNTTGGANGSGAIMLDTDNQQNIAAFTGTPAATLGEQIGGTGGGATHDHTFTGTAIDLAVKYRDAIQATKD